MRYQELLESDKEHISTEEALSLIQNNQYAQQWIKESNNTPLFRGSINLKTTNTDIGIPTNMGFHVAPVIMSSRTDRKPKDTSRLIQQQYDKAAAEIGYIKRSEAIFVVPTPSLARTYGYLGVFFPLTPWEINWSITVKDFYSQAGGEDGIVRISNDIEKNKQFIEDNYNKGMLSMAAQNLLGEILVKCKKYILVPVGAYVSVSDKLTVS